MIPEWLSFQNEFIPSPYISLYLFTWYRNEILFPHNSFRNDFIPVFNPNEILVLVWHFILVSCKPKMNSVPRWKRKPCSLGREAQAYCFQDGGQTVVFKTAEPVDFVMWMQYELHSGTKLIPEWNSFWYHVNSPLDSENWKSTFKRNSTSIFGSPLIRICLLAFQVYPKNWWQCPSYYY